MNLSLRGLLAALLLLPCSTTLADQHAIQIDGEGLDWSGITAAHVDTSGDGGVSGFDFGALTIADDARFLFFRIELGSEGQLDELNDLVLYLDTDLNAATGLTVGGVGAELEWRFGNRNGTFHVGGGSTVYHDDIRLRSGPTVSSTWFEVAIGRDTLPDGTNALFTGSQVRFLFRDEDGIGDRLPDSGSITYTLDQGAPLTGQTTPLGRQQPTDLRLVTYNVRTDSPWDPGEEPRFGRQFAAVDADIWCFQEIYNHTEAEVVTLVNNWVAAGAGLSWSSADNNDCLIVSRYPVIGTWSLSGNLAALIDATAVLGEQLLIVNAHLPCCTNESGRQSEVDEILAFLKDATHAGGLFTLWPNTPIVVTGDLNLVGYSSTLESLLTGDIADEATWGADAAPDWDASPLHNLLSLQTEKRMAYTWRNDNSSFWPGLLDFFIYSDSVMTTGNHYVLYTPEMSPSELAAAGLVASDSNASDHLLRVADFRIDTSEQFVRGDCNGDTVVDISDPVAQLALLFLGGASPCHDACDHDDDGALTIVDVTAAIHALFGLGPPPSAPFPLCGSDATVSALSCGVGNCP